MKYFGGKNGAGSYQTIINYLPPHKTYIEPFLGSGAILRYKKRAEVNIGIEIDKKTISQFWKPAPKGTIIINDNALEWLKNYDGHGEDTLIYLDPPYPLSSRRNKAKVYRHEMTDEQHIELLTFLKRCSSRIIISTYKNPLYLNLLGSWNMRQYNSMTRKGKAVETLYMNYEPPTILHDYNYIGKNFTDRQRIRRKINRFRTKLSRLPETERNAIIYHFLDHFRKS